MQFDFKYSYNHLKYKRYINLSGINPQLNCAKRNVMIICVNLCH